MGDAERLLRAATQIRTSAQAVPASPWWIHERFENQVDSRWFAHPWWGDEARVRALDERSKVDPTITDAEIEETWQHADSLTGGLELPLPLVEYLLACQPSVLLAVADALEHAAVRALTKVEHGGRPRPVWSHERDAVAIAVAIATALLGEEASDG